MARIETFPAVPPAAISRVLATFDRAQLEGFIAVAIDLLDLADGDPDLEEDDDPGQCTEDEINTNLQARIGGGSGCTISDSDLCAVEHGERTTEEDFYQGEGSARHEDDDDEPHRSPPQWPLGDGEGFLFRPPPGRD